MTARLITGSWMSIVHWSDVEAKYWQDEIRAFTDDDWRALVRDMNSIGMDTLVIQEVVRNQMYAGKHDIERQGYHGQAFYPSKLHRNRMDMTAVNPIEAILSQADALDMKVFPGVGLYAWFDFTQPSLLWHIALAKELWEMYGHHKSFYGWYISEETFGNLGNTVGAREDIVKFFRQFRRFAKEITPDKPIMLAPNCHDIKSALDYWPKLLENLDILCPFGFHRMPKGDISGTDAAKLLKTLCDENNCRLWLDMEVFLFENDKELSALYPRDIEGIISDLKKFDVFEKILCYQYPGLMNAPWALRQPGGTRTVKLFDDYKKYYDSVCKKG